MELALRISIQSKLLVSAGIIASIAALWHLLCIIGGPSWFEFARAPQQIIDSSQHGTLLAPLGTIIVASLMFACTVFSFSGAGFIRKVPLLKPALITISFICTVRALIAIPILITPDGYDIWEIVASSVWLYVGVCFIFGTIEQYKLVKTAT
jgi:hypothetical protein